MEEHHITDLEVQAPEVSPQSGGLDALKVAGAILVLLQHVTGAVVTAPTAPPVGIVFFNGLTWIAVPIFVAASGYLYGRKIRSGTLQVGPWVRGRCRRILVPYIAWSIIYLAMRVAFRGGLTDLDWAQVVFGGGAFYTLWFLPMLLWVSVLTALIARSRRALLVLAAASAGVAVAVVVEPLLGGSNLSRLPAIVAFVVGLAAWVSVFAAAAWVAASGAKRGVIIAYAGAVSGTLGAAALATIAATRPQLSAVRPAAILAAQIAAPCALRLSLAWPVAYSVRLRTVASLGLGFYLAQGGVLNVFQHIVPTTALPPFVWIAVTTLVVGLISVLICAALYAVKLLRPLVA